MDSCELAGFNSGSDNLDSSATSCDIDRESIEIERFSIFRGTNSDGFQSRFCDAGNRYLAATDDVRISLFNADAGRAYFKCSRSLPSVSAAGRAACSAGSRTGGRFGGRSPI